MGELHLVRWVSSTSNGDLLFSRLSLDWQEELGGYADEERYSPLWFKEMIRQDKLVKS